MWEIEVFLCICIVALGILVSISDIKEGLIKNKTLLLFGSIGICLDIVYYGFLVKDIISDFLINVIIVVIISMVLFYSHAFAGGDCKYCIILALLYPARFYIEYSGSIFTLWFPIGSAILYGYIYLFLASIISLIKKKTTITREYIANNLKSFICSFSIATIYITGINLLFNILEKNGLYVNSWIISIACMCVAFAIGKVEILRKRSVIIGVIIFDVVFSIALHIIPVSLNFENYILVITLLLCQMTIRTNLYELIAVSELKVGMILSTFSSIQMQNSRVRGLPPISAEDLRSRLNQVQIDAIGRWAKGRDISQVIIVKKVPFALFITWGFISYFIIWSGAL